MRDLLAIPFAGFPMVASADATGRVAAVYADASRRLPFVPSLLKSLAVCPPYLVLAWQQAAPMLDRDEFGTAADEVVAEARSASARLAVAGGAAATMRAFTEPLARMLLLSCGLHAALHGRLTGAPATAQAPPQPSGPLDDQAPSAFDTADSALYGAVRATFDTPLVNTIWRRLSADGQLAAAWPAIERTAKASRQHADRLQGYTYQRANTLPWEPVASPPALAAAEIADAAAGMSAVLDAYVKTLPRVLSVVASL